MGSVKKIINKVFGGLGLVLVQKENYRSLLIESKKKDKLYGELLQEYAKVFKEFVLTDLELNDQDFKLLSRLIGTQKSEGIYLSHLLKTCLLIAGDVCEFGVAQGATSSLIANTIQPTEKKIWLFDSFEGLPKPTEKDKLKDDIFNLGSMDAYQGLMACKEDLVLAKLAEIGFPRERAVLVKGFIEDTIKQPNLPKQVSFAYVDFDFYEPIKVALIFLDEVLSSGGIIIVDDYDFFSTGAKTAVEEFLIGREDKYVLELPIDLAGHFCILRKKG